ncbi:hypothetical protein JCM11641_004753 [Rhodosporidiobolus odoratus]
MRSPVSDGSRRPRCLKEALDLRAQILNAKNGRPKFQHIASDAPDTPEWAQLQKRLAFLHGWPSLQGFDVPLPPFDYEEDVWLEDEEAVEEEEGSQPTQLPFTFSAPAAAVTSYTPPLSTSPCSPPDSVLTTFSFTSLASVATTIPSSPEPDPSLPSFDCLFASLQCSPKDTDSRGGQKGAIQSRCCQSNGKTCYIICSSGVLLCGGRSQVPLPSCLVLPPCLHLTTTLTDPAPGSLRRKICLTPSSRLEPVLPQLPLQAAYGRIEVILGDYFRAAGDILQHQKLTRAKERRRIEVVACGSRK